MSFSFKIKDGDLDTSTTVFGVVTGVEKLTQELSMWLREQYGIDRFHPQYGSVLDAYIGETINDQTQSEIQIEVERVLLAFSALQRQAVQANKSKYDRNELLDTIEEVRCVENLDSINVYIRFRTALGFEGVVNESISL